MIVHVVERVLQSRTVSRAIVATDDERIFNVVVEAGFEAMMTSPEHRSGSDRLAEVARRLEKVEFLINIQGDEPLISPETVDRVASTLIKQAGTEIVTASEPILDPSDVLNPDIVKVVTGNDRRALYFSRSPVPYPREAVRRHGSLELALENEVELLRSFRKHTGIYGFERRVLLDYNGWPQSELERTESLEQLRALEHGIPITVVDAASASMGVDTIEDLEKVREGYKQLMSIEAERSGEMGKRGNG
jgi:3-deoxy-manno-octulosonate cytidylyltransferase (CMP-KDO synthetase)